MRARNAYHAGNYKEVFLEYYGEELDESNALLQARSKTILTMQRKYNSYVNNVKLGREIEALNALLEGITLSITTNMFIPSLIYAGMIVFTIIYVIIAHGAKKDLKQYKRDKRAAKKSGLSYKEYMESNTT